MANRARLFTSTFALILIAGALAAHRVGDSLAWGQDAAPDGGSAQTDSDRLDAQQNTTPANVAGSWCGNVNDDLLGGGTINLEIHQKGKKLSGPWSDSLGGSGSSKGKINGDAITSTLKLRTSRCKFAIVGTLVSPGEIMGSYSVFGCRQSDAGSFDITTPCTP